MILGIALATVALAAAGWGTYEGVRRWQGIRSQQRAEAAAGREAVAERIRNNTTDHIQWFRTQWARAAAALEKARLGAIADQDAAKEATGKIEKSFTDEKTPAMSYVIWIAILCGVWAAAALTQILLDVPIVTSINGGNLVFGVLVTLMFVSVPIAASIALKWLAARRAAEKLTPLAYRASVVGLLAALAASICIMVALAPLRAENEYADPIREVEQSIVMFQEDGDATGVDFAKVELEQLQQEQRQSADFNQVAILLTAMLEFGTGFAVPTGYLMLMLLGAKRREKEAARAVTAATNAKDDHQASELEALSNDLMGANVPQARIRQALAEIAAQNPEAAAPGQGTAAQATPGPATTGPVPAAHVPGTVAPPVAPPAQVDAPANIPVFADRTFDQS